MSLPSREGLVFGMRTNEAVVRKWKCPGGEDCNSVFLWMSSQVIHPGERPLETNGEFPICERPIEMVEEHVYDTERVGKQCPTCGSYETYRHMRHRLICGECGHECGMSGAKERPPRGCLPVWKENRNEKSQEGLLRTPVQDMRQA